MKTIILRIGLALLIGVGGLFAVTSCKSDKSDPEIEAKIFGEWKSTEFEDGLMMGENITFYTDHTFKQELGVFASDFTPLFHIVGSGTWTASKKYLTLTFDEKSIGMTYCNSYAIEIGDVAEVVQEMRKEAKDSQVYKIKSIGPDSSGDISMTIEDAEGDSTTYAMIASFSPEEEDSPDSTTPEDDPYSIDYPQVAESDVHLLDVKYLYGAKDSTLKPHKETTYEPEKAFDGDKSTCWAIDVKNYHDENDRLINVKIDGDLLTHIVIYSGYRKSEELFQKNNRPRNILIGIVDPDNSKLIKSKIYEGELKDTSDPQRLELDIPVSVRGETISIFIDDWYDGTTYKDHLCISEIQFFGD